MEHTPEKDESEGMQRLWRLDSNWIHLRAPDLLGLLRRTVTKLWRDGFRLSCLPDTTRSPWENGLSSVRGRCRCRPGCRFIVTIFLSATRPGYTRYDPWSLGVPKTCRAQRGSVRNAPRVL